MFLYYKETTELRTYRLNRRFSKRPECLLKSKRSKKVRPAGSDIDLSECYHFSIFFLAMDIWNTRRRFSLSAAISSLRFSGLRKLCDNVHAYCVSTVSTCISLFHACAFTVYLTRRWLLNASAYRTSRCNDEWKWSGITIVNVEIAKLLRPIHGHRLRCKLTIY